MRSTPKDGIKRIKMRGKDAATVRAIMFDKLHLSLNRPTAIRSDLRSNEEVEKLAEHFAEISRKHEIRRVCSIDGECEEMD